MKIGVSEISLGILKIISDFEEKFKEFGNLKLEEQRVALDTMYLTGAPLIQVDNVDNKEITWNNLEIPIRIYQTSSKEKLPILVYFHGGGWVLGSLDSQDRLCRLIASKYPCVVISVGYRLAPEHKFPSAVDDCLAILDWLVNGGAEDNWNINKIICSGDSARGNLAIVAPNLFNKKYKDENMKIFYSVPIYPVTDLSDFNNETYTKYGKGYCLDQEEMIWYGNQYLNDKNDTLDPRASPLLNSDFSDYSPTVLITAGYDVLREEGLEFAKKLADNAIQSDLVNFEDMTHSFLRFADLDENSRLNIDKIAYIIISKWKLI